MYTSIDVSKNELKPIAKYNSEMFLSSFITDNLRELDPTLVASRESWEYANAELETKTVDEVSRSLGFNVKNYDHIVVAGQLVMLDHCRVVPSKIFEYIALSNLNTETKSFLENNATEIDLLLEEFEWTNYKFDYISASSMVKLYLSRHQYLGKPYEKPTTMYARICAQLYWNKSFQEFRNAFIQMTLGKYTVASAGMLNAGQPKPQMASCFLTKVGDSRLNIYSGLARVGEISAGKGGVGLTLTAIRHSEIAGGGMSKGVLPVAKLYDNIISYSKQGRARNGAITFFIPPWHIDVQEMIASLDESVGKHENHLHNSDICMWMPWVFWDRVREDAKWTLFCPKYVKNIQSLYGHEFTRAYVEAEGNSEIPNRYKVVMKARDLLRQISKMWQKKGKPFIMNGDSANFKSNHKHIGYIPGSNLCLEIVEYFDENTINVCNLSSLSLSSFAKNITNPLNWSDILANYNFGDFGNTVRLVVRNLNNMIDCNYSPLTDLYNYWGDITTSLESKGNPITNANDKYRSLGIGVQGLSTAFQKLDLSYNSPLAAKLDECIFSCIYFNAIVESVQEAIENGVCEAYISSPISRGQFQFDLWKQEWEERWEGKGCKTVPTSDVFTPMNPSEWGQKDIILSSDFGIVCTIKPNWNSLREAVMLFGMRNSLLIALMPTMSSAKPLRNTETVELHPSNIYAVDLVYGSYPIVNYLMVKDLKDMKLWNNEIASYIIIKDGHIDTLAEYLVEKNYIQLHSTAYERVLHLQEKYIGMMELRPTLIKERSFRRNKYVCQSSSSNICMTDPKIEKLEALFMIDGEYGNKTIQYYLYQRSQVRNSTLNSAEGEGVFNPSTMQNGEGVFNSSTTQSGGCADGLCCTA